MISGLGFKDSLHECPILESLNTRSRNRIYNRKGPIVLRKKS